MISSSQVNNQQGDQNMLTNSHPSLPTDEGHTSVAFDTSGCISTFEIGSTSRRYDEARKMSSSLVKKHWKSIYRTVICCQKIMCN
ncbi:hypothetical protein H5410_059885 [Solanum commersonii]|uniref:Uncharacterized protein n=1 Tax=Solanum commersonii TaxID=4109 RepID=A0A9J5W3Z9_SOLCO|nr:hypothetical protein H5410_059885 [Solanum commersonii]